MVEVARTVGGGVMDVQVGREKHAFWGRVEDVQMKDIYICVFLGQIKIF